jgi:hypothetical protein
MVNYQELSRIPDLDARRDEFVKLAQNLRDAHNQARTRFLDFLLGAEKDEPMWRVGSSFASFGKFLEHHNIIKASTLEAWRAIDEVEETRAAVSVIGPDAAMIAARLPKEKRAAAVVEMIAVARDEGQKVGLNSVPLSVQTAVRLAEKQQPAETRSVRRMSRLDELEVENRKLRHENACLKKEVARLEAELAGRPGRKKKASSEAAAD